VQTPFDIVDPLPEVLPHSQDDLYIPVLSLTPAQALHLAVKCPTLPFYLYSDLKAHYVDRHRQARELAIAVSYLRNLLTRMDDIKSLESEGLTRTASTLLHTLDIPHTPYVGRISLLNDRSQTLRSLYPHYWIQMRVPHVPDVPDIPDAYGALGPSGKSGSNAQTLVIDYRAREWLRGKAYVPHGIFCMSAWPRMCYSGQPIRLEPLNPLNFEMLTMSTVLDEHNEIRARRGLELEKLAGTTAMKLTQGLRAC
jgi:hypothetical protein